MLDGFSVLTRLLRRSALCGLIALIVLPAAAAAQPPLAGANPGQDTGADESATDDERYIVTFRSSGTRSEDTAAGARAVAAARGRVARELPGIRAVSAWLPEQALESLRHRPDVESIEVDARRYLMASGPPWSDTNENGETIPYGIGMVQADQLSDVAAGNRKICIIDTGYYRAHDDLQYANVTATPDAVTGDPYLDEYGHGTHVAGTIAGVGGNGIGVRGVNPSQRINLHIIKAFNKYGQWAYSSDVIYALAQCRAAGSHIVNMSFGGPQSVTAEATAFADAYAAGVLLVAAAGNGGSGDYSYPASYPSVISVAAMDANEGLAYFSQYNDEVELAAPGVAVLSTLPAPYGYASWNGTSMATPHVSGAAALIWSYNPAWTNAQIRQALQQTAKDEGSPGKDIAFGHGLVQAKAALDWLCGPNCVPPPPPARPSGGCLVDTGQGDFGTDQHSNVEVGLPGDVQLHAQLDEQSESVSDTGVPFTLATWRAQTFTPRAFVVLSAVEIYLSCEYCNGTLPQIKISVQETSGGLPNGIEAATIYIGMGAAGLGPGWRRAELSNPVYLAPREYALVVRPWPDDASIGGYQWRLGETGTYAGGKHLVSTNGGASWSSQSGADLAFRAHLRAVVGPYDGNSGWLRSSLMDSLVPAGGTVQWDTLNWTATVPPGTSIKFQVAGSDSAAGPFNFVGPDGTAATFFTTSGTFYTTSSAPVSRFERYLRYRATLTTTDLMQTPVLHDVTACYTTVPGAATILRGTVVNAFTGDPIAGASVGAGAYSATTDGNGGFEIFGIAPGTYSLTASASGYLGATLSGVRVVAGFVTTRQVALRVPDTTPPSPPGGITSSHDGGAGIADPTIEVAWEAAVDTLSGVDGYSYFFDRAPASPCEATKDVEEFALQATSGALADGTWYVHVCAVDQAGNWGAVAHGGPYAIGTPCVTDTTQADFFAGIRSGVDLTSVPGDVKLAAIPGGGAAIDQSQTFSDWDAGYIFNTVDWEAQAFTPAVSGVLTKLEVNLWCFECSGANPPITVEIRNVVGSVPGDEVLAAATVPGFSSSTPTFYSVVFATPPRLVAGVQYAFVLRLQTNRTAGFYVVTPSLIDRYTRGAVRYSRNAGSSWDPDIRDFSFRTYMAAPAGYAASGTLESAVMDTGWRMARWSSLSWGASSPAGTSVKFQIASSHSASGPFNFIGPDGTAGTFFTTSGAALAPLSLARYLKYKVFPSTGNTSVTPALHDVTLCHEPIPVSSGSFFTVAPCRLLDTRQPGQGPALASGVARLLPMPGACGVPPTASAVAINVTVTNGTGGGHLTLFPGGSAVPQTSTINFSAGQTRANNAVVPLGADGDLGLFAAVDGSVHVIVDVFGYFE